MNGTKLIVNQTQYYLQGNITVRTGDNPGGGGTSYPFSLNANSQNMIHYGSEQNPFMDAFAVTLVENGAVVSSYQQVITRGSEMDNLFNMNDTLYISLNGQSIVVTGANTWTV